MPATSRCYLLFIIPSSYHLALFSNETSCFLLDTRQLQCVPSVLFFCFSFHYLFISFNGLTQELNYPPFPLSSSGDKKGRGKKAEEEFSVDLHRIVYSPATEISDCTSVCREQKEKGRYV